MIRPSETCGLHTFNEEDYLGAPMSPVVLSTSLLLITQSHIISNVIKDKNVMCNKKLNHTLRPVLPLYDYIS